MASGIPSTDQSIEEIAFTTETNIAWSNLPDDEIIVLFTPTIAQLSKASAAEQENIFQAIYDALAKKHAGEIKRMSYDPDKGIKDPHVDYINESATILIIVSEPPGPNEYAAISRTIELQLNFSRAAMDAYHIIHEHTEPDALVLLYCGESNFSCPDNIGTCLRVSDQSEQAWDAVAMKLLLEAKQFPLS